MSGTRAGQPERSHTHPEGPGPPRGQERFMLCAPQKVKEFRRSPGAGALFLGPGPGDRHHGVRDEGQLVG